MTVRVVTFDDNVASAVIPTTSLPTVTEVQFENNGVRVGDQNTTKVNFNSNLTAALDPADATTVIINGQAGGGSSGTAGRLEVAVVNNTGAIMTANRFYSLEDNVLDEATNTVTLTATNTGATTVGQSGVFYLETEIAIGGTGTGVTKGIVTSTTAISTTGENPIFINNISGGIGIGGVTEEILPGYHIIGLLLRSPITASFLEFAFDGYSTTRVSSLPNSPANVATNKKYELNVPITGNSTWTEATTVDPGRPYTFLDESVDIPNQTNVNKINFSGAGVTASLNLLDDTTLQINIPSNNADGHIIENSTGTDLTQRTNLQFSGAGVSLTDDNTNDRTIVSISGTAGANISEIENNGTRIGTDSVNKINFSDSTLTAALDGSDSTTVNVVGLPVERAIFRGNSVAQTVSVTTTFTPRFLGTRQQIGNAFELRTLTGITHAVVRIQRTGTYLLKFKGTLRADTTSTSAVNVYDFQFPIVAGVTVTGGNSMEENYTTYGPAPITIEETIMITTSITTRDVSIRLAKALSSTDDGIVNNLSWEFTRIT